MTVFIYQTKWVNIIYVKNVAVIFGIIFKIPSFEIYNYKIIIKCVFVSMKTRLSRQFPKFFLKFLSKFPLKTPVSRLSRFDSSPKSFIAIPPNLKLLKFCVLYRSLTNGCVFIVPSVSHPSKPLSPLPLAIRFLYSFGLQIRSYKGIFS